MQGKEITLFSVEYLEQLLKGCEWLQKLCKEYSIEVFQGMVEQDGKLQQQILEAQAAHAKAEQAKVEHQQAQQDGMETIALEFAELVKNAPESLPFFLSGVKEQIVGKEEAFEEAMSKYPEELEYWKDHSELFDFFV
jgi:hypothetical protein